MLLKSLLKKEWDEIVHERLIVLSLIFMPLLFVGMAIYSMTSASSDNLPAFPPQGFISPLEFVQFIILSQFLGVLLTVPSVGSVLIAAYAIIGEKVQKTFEPLLATPISEAQLFASKLFVAAGIPVLTTFFSYILLILALLAINVELIAKTIFTPMWLLGLLLLSPLLCLFCALVSMIVSSKVKDIRAAQQVGALVVLPVIFGLLALFVKQMVTLPALLLCLAVLLVLNVLVFVLAVKLFKREAIITIWT